MGALKGYVMEQKEMDRFFTDSGECKKCYGEGKIFLDVDEGTPGSKYQASKKCLHCNGSGYEPVNYCEKCNGTGSLDYRNYDGCGSDADPECDECDGTGLEAV